MSINAGDMREQPGSIARARAMSAGATPGEYPTVAAFAGGEDNCDSTHPLNVDFVVPSNFQRIVGARLSFKLRAYRTYDKPAAAGPHIHTWVLGGQTNAPAPTYSIGTNNAGNPINGPSGASPPSAPFGFQTSTDNGVGGAQGSAFASADLVGGNGHTHGQNLGVTEASLGAVAITVALDGTDITAKLGGGSGFTADQFELDVAPYLGGNPKAGLHLIALQPNANCRLKAMFYPIFVVNTGVR